MAAETALRTVPTAPRGLAARGKRLWTDLWALVDFNPAETVLLEEACRMADRLEGLDRILRGENHELLRVECEDVGEFRFYVDAALSESRQLANTLKQIIAALRLPDELNAKRPQKRQGASGVGVPRLQGRTSAKDRLRSVG